MPVTHFAPTLMPVAHFAPTLMPVAHLLGLPEQELYCFWPLQRPGAAPQRQRKRYSGPVADDDGKACADVVDLMDPAMVDKYPTLSKKALKALSYSMEGISRALTNKCRGAGPWKAGWGDSLAQDASGMINYDDAIRSIGYRHGDQGKAAQKDCKKLCEWYRKPYDRKNIKIRDVDIINMCRSNSKDRLQILMRGYIHRELVSKNGEHLVPRCDWDRVRMECLTNGEVTWLEPMGIAVSQGHFYCEKAWLMNEKSHWERTGQRYDSWIMESRFSQGISKAIIAEKLSTLMHNTTVEAVPEIHSKGLKSMNNRCDCSFGTLGYKA